MKTPEQLKGTIRNIAEEKHLHSQEVLQMFLFERILERLAVSKYRDNFILKGGLLISSMIGISERTTMDMDTTVRGIPMEEGKITPIIKEIINLNVGDGIHFLFRKIEPIRKIDLYSNFRVHMEAVYGKINSPMKIDITTGDEITPDAIQYRFPLLFEDRTISIMTYTLETVLAEKYETIIKRNISTTRARDFYDLHILYRTHFQNIDLSILKEAVENTARQRDSLKEISDWRRIAQEIRQEPVLIRQWENYMNDNQYASVITFDEVLDTFEEMGTVLEKMDLLYEASSMQN